jgi:microcystin-dependent protein
VIVWLKGGNTTYYWRSNHKVRVLDATAIDTKISFNTNGSPDQETVTSITAVDSGFNASYFFKESHPRGERFHRGMIMMWSGSSVPNGWAICDGGNGTPDLRGRFVVGAGQGSGLSNRPVGQTGGAERVTLTEGQLPPHDHPINDPGHFHTWTASRQRAGIDDQNNTSELSKGDNWVADTMVKNTDTKTTGITVQNAGGGQSHENMPPFYALAYIMKL